MFSSIVYYSTTGSCKKYAELLSAKLHIPARPLGKEYVPEDTKIIYVGWLMAGKVMGHAKAAAKYDVGAVVQVGMGPENSKSEKICREKNPVRADAAVFTRQGRFNINKLPLPYKLIMKLKNKEIAARLEKLGSLDEGQKATLKMAKTGVGEPASWCVDDIVKWCENN